MSESKPDFNEDFAYAIGIAVGICLAVLVGYIIIKTQTAEGWLSLILIPIGLISYVFYMKSKYNITRI